MGQKTHPVGFRLGIVRLWDANWYEEKHVAQKLAEDLKIRAYIFNRLKKAGLSRVSIDRRGEKIVLTIFTSRPGVVIGKSGKEIAQIESELKQVSGKDIKILIHEIKRPELDAQLVADNIAQQLEGRVAFRRAMKGSVQAAMRMGAEGIRVRCSGRLGGAEMSRTEQYKEVRVPLHTLRADIDFALSTAKTIYGTLGVKVWICRGELIGGMNPVTNAGAGPTEKFRGN